MLNTTFTDRVYDERVEKDTILCVGLDPQLRYIPPHLLKAAAKEFGSTPEAAAHAIVEFFRPLVPALAKFCCAMKPQSAFYEPYGKAGIGALEQITQMVRDEGVPVCLDAKRSDGGDSAESYADGYIGDTTFPTENGSFIKKPGPMRVDAITVLPTIGEMCTKYFLDNIRTFGTGIFAVTKTSFTPNSWIEMEILAKGTPLYEAVAHWISTYNEGTEGTCGYRNFGVVVGATKPEEAIRMREILPNTFFLIPGLGAQGGTADDAVVSFDKNGFGGIVNDARRILYAYLKEEGCSSEAYVEAAVRAAQRARNDLNAALARKKTFVA